MKSINNESYTEAILSFVKETIRNPEFFNLSPEKQKEKAYQWIKESGHNKSAAGK